MTATIKGGDRAAGNEPVRRLGRPRDGAIDEAILDAALAEMIDNGMALSMEAVATRAGVAKTTLYRRFANSDELAYRTIAAYGVVDPEPPVGEVREQLLWLIEEQRQRWNDPRYAAVMRRVAADGTRRPEMYRQCRDRLIRPYLDAMDAVLRRAVAEGTIRDGMDLSWVRQTIMAPILAAAFTLRDRVSAAQAAFTVDTVLAGVAR